MKFNLLDILACPNCNSPLELAEAKEAYDEIWEGVLACQHCTAVFPIIEGMPQLYLNDNTWSTKAAEAEGWVTIHKDLGIYEVTPDSIDLQIPYYPEEPWLEVSKGFDQALNLLPLTGKETILDLGAGRGWAAKEFAKRGCRVVALDVVADVNVGLGRGKAIMEYAGVYFDRVIGAGENLPFGSASFDVVFCAATLHHASDLPAFFKNINDVLKPGGRLCAMHEPCISVIEDEEGVLARDARHELAVGIHETRPNYLDYVAALAAGHFTDFRLRPASGLSRTEDNLVEWARNLGAIRPSLGLGLTQPRLLASQVALFVKRQIIARRKGVWSAAKKQLHHANGRALVETAVLLWAGGEMLLLAKKNGRVAPTNF